MPQVLKRNTLQLSSLAVAVSVIATLMGCNSSGRSSSGTSRLSRDAEIAASRSTLFYLASPQMQGRGPGTQGLDRAGEFLANEFRRMGLQPGVEGSYFQPFEYRQGMKVDAGSRLMLGSTSLVLDEGFRPNSISGKTDAFDGELVFAGYGISSKDRKYDDFEGVDVKGKVALIMRYEPRDASGVSRWTKEKDDWSADSGLPRKVMNAQAKGAVAVLLVNPPGVETDDLMSFGGGRGSGAIRVPVMQVKREAVDAALGGSTTPAELARGIDENEKPGSRGLGIRASGQSALKPNVMMMRNVVAVLPGESDEAVVVGAHYDHVGMGGPGSLMPGSTAVHPGADDNGSGTTALLTLARRMAADSAAGKKPARTVVFIAFSVEEQGLIGSKWWVDHPTVPLEKVAYMLNLDMVGRLRNNAVLHGGSGTAEGLEKIVADAYADVGLTPKSMGKGGVGPSDHESFSRKKIPVVFLFTGLHPEYHRPADKPELINYPGISKVVDLAERIVNSMLVAPKTAYVDKYDSAGIDLSPGEKAPGHGNLMRDTAATRGAMPQDGVHEQVGLGLMPDYAEAEKGMRIGGVTKNSAADRAGLKEGDFLVELDGTPINSVQDLQNVYDRHKAGDQVKAVYMRNGQRAEVQVTFRRRAARN